MGRVGWVRLGYGWDEIGWDGIGRDGMGQGWMEQVDNCASELPLPHALDSSAARRCHGFAAPHARLAIAPAH